MIMKMPIISINYGYDGGYDFEDDFPDNSSTNTDNLDNNNGLEDFSEYMWMMNEEEFDKQEMQRLEEEALSEELIEAMADEELVNEVMAAMMENPHALCDTILPFDSHDILHSNLNPLAEEFIPNNHHANIELATV